MGKNVIALLLFPILACSFLGCAEVPTLGTGQKFVQALNPQGDKMTLVYFYRRDGGFTKLFANFPPIVVMKDSPGSKDKFPVAILGDKMYRPMLFEPGEVRFLVKGGGDETVVLKAGETRCIEAVPSMRGIVVIGVNEIPLDECLEVMKDLELAATITELRRRNGLPPLMQQGFRDLEPGPTPSSLSKDAEKK